MTPVGSGFNRIARSYDLIAKLVFGKSISQSHLAFLDDLPVNATILVLGGGSGAFLTSIPELHQKEVLYLDASPVMLSLAARQLKGRYPNVRFVEGTELNIPATVKPSVVITHFYMDMFPEDVLNQIIKNVGGQCEPDVKWIVSDFVKPVRFRQQVLLRIMYRFFRILTKIEATDLPDWEQIMATNGYQPMRSQFYAGKFIKAVLFERIHVPANTIR
jgi:tRNA (cmo5U34)-methyltransferase